MCFTPVCHSDQLSEVSWGQPCLAISFCCLSYALVTPLKPGDFQKTSTKRDTLGRRCTCSWFPGCHFTRWTRPWKVFTQPLWPVPLPSSPLMEFFCAFSRQNYLSSCFVQSKTQTSLWKLKLGSSQIVLRFQQQSNKLMFIPQTGFKIITLSYTAHRKLDG